MCIRDSPKPTLSLTLALFRLVKCPVPNRTTERRQVDDEERRSTGNWPYDDKSPLHTTRTCEAWQMAPRSGVVMTPCGHSPFYTYSDAAVIITGNGCLWRRSPINVVLRIWTLLLCYYLTDAHWNSTASKHEFLHCNVCCGVQLQFIMRLS